MKGDFSRSTFRPEQHYSGVRMQQGRVQMDADWNEQLDIQQHLDESTTLDLTGGSGAPRTGGGFRIGSKLDGSDLTVSPGHFYADGILCENEAAIQYAGQVNGDLPDPTTVSQLLTKASTRLGVAYLDVWRRHITALDDDFIREVALGGPDTATRLRTVWQVKVLPLAGKTITETPSLIDLLQKRASTENDLLNAEQAGDMAKVALLRPALAQLDGSIRQALASTGIDCGLPATAWTNLTAAPADQLTARIQPGQTTATPCELLPRTGYQRLENQLYRVEIHDPGDIGTATFKWSRENGSVLTKWLSQDNLNLKVASAGRGAPLNFSPGDWIELSDANRDLLGLPGTFVQVAQAEGDVITIQPPASPIKLADFPANPRIRRWDQGGSTGAVKVTVPGANDGFVALESGIEVKFSGTAFKTGDYWLIPARTSLAASDIGDIQWPRNGLVPLPQPPAGIRHHYARLALVYLDTLGRLFVLSDCRSIFASLNALQQLFYVGGDGQETFPGTQLPGMLQVGVSNGEDPVAGALVRFTVTTGLGTLGGSAAGTVDVFTDGNGVAATAWTLDATNSVQVVEARLIGPGNVPLHLPVRFSAAISFASPSAIRIADIRVGINLPLRNATWTVVEDILRGIRVKCTGAVSPSSLNSSLNCFVTLYLPYPMTYEERGFWSSGIFGYQPLLLTAVVYRDYADPSVIRWQVMDPPAIQFLEILFSRLMSFNISKIPVRLSVKGNFILPAHGTLAPLDAEAYLTATGMQLPTGDGRAGGDLEIYFVLANMKPANPIPEVRLSDIIPAPGGIGTQNI